MNALKSFLRNVWNDLWNNDPPTSVIDWLKRVLTPVRPCVRCRGLGEEMNGRNVCLRCRGRGLEP